MFKPKADNTNSSVIFPKQTSSETRWYSLQLWLMDHLSIWLPILASILFAPLLAFFIVDETWHLALTIALLIPGIILFLRYPFIAIIIWLVAAPFIQITPTGAHRVVFWLLHRAIIPGALITVVLAGLLHVRKDVHIRFNRADIAIILSGIYLVVSVIFSYSNTGPLFINLYDRFLVPFAAYWLIRFIPIHEKEIQRIFPIAAILIAIQFSIGIMSWFIPQVLPDEWLRLQGFRTTGSLGHYTSYTTMMIVYGLFTYHAAGNIKTRLPQFLYLAAFGMATIGVFISFSRGSWLGGGLVLLGLVLLYPKLTARFVGIMSIVMLILATTVFANLFGWANERLGDENTALSRLVIYNMSWQMIRAKPIFGWGYETYDRYDEQFRTRVANFVVSREFTSHNTFLTVLAERGIVGFLLYYFPIFLWLSYTIKVWHRLPPDGIISRQFVGILWLMILFQAVIGNFSDAKRNTFLFVTWWMPLALLSKFIEAHLEKEDLAPPAWMRKQT